jgi:predicted component of type VI protein secretion system
MAKQAIAGSGTTKKPTTMSLTDLANSVKPVTAQEKANVAALKDDTAVTAAKSAQAVAATDAASTAKLTGGKVVNGLVTMPDNYQVGPTTPAPVTPAPLTPEEIAAKTAADQAAANKAISNKNALALLTSTLQGYGIDSPDGSISNAILGLIQSNYDAPTIQALIESPNAASSKDPNVVALAGAWNARFSGNVAREKAGLTPLSPAEYISTENSYKAVMARAG